MYVYICIHTNIYIYICIYEDIHVNIYILMESGDYKSPDF